MAKPPFPPKAPAKGDKKSGKPMPPWLNKSAPAGKKAPAMKSGGKVKAC